MRRPRLRSVPYLVLVASWDQRTTGDRESSVALMTNSRTQAARIPADRLPTAVSRCYAGETKIQPEPSGHRPRRANDHLRRRHRDRIGDRRRLKTRTERLL